MIMGETSLFGNIFLNGFIKMDLKYSDKLQFYFGSVRDIPSVKNNMEKLK